MGADVTGGLLPGDAGHGVADCDALVEGGEGAEHDAPPQGGRACNRSRGRGW